jgi:transcriptional regulator with XRE-family HTH domain
MKHEQNSNPEQQLINCIHSALKANRLTLSDVAAYLGISYIHMASMSNGARKISGLKIEKQRKLAKFLGITMVQFFVLCGLLREEDLLTN